MNIHITEVDQDGIDLVKVNEAWRSSPYLDTNFVATCGFGFTYYPNGQRVTMQDPPITLEWGEVILKKLLHTYELGVDSLTRDDITQGMFNSLVDFTYNLGVDSLRRSTLLKIINNNPLDPAVDNEFRKWVFVGGVKSKGISARRERDILMYHKK